MGAQSAMYRIGHGMNGAWIGVGVGVGVGVGHAGAEGLSGGADAYRDIAGVKDAPPTEVYGSVGRTAGGWGTAELPAAGVGIWGLVQKWGGAVAGWFHRRGGIGSAGVSKGEGRGEGF